MQRDPSLAAGLFWSLDPSQPLTAAPFVKPDATSTNRRSGRCPMSPLHTADHLTEALTEALTVGLDPEAA